MAKAQWRLSPPSTVATRQTAARLLLVLCYFACSITCSPPFYTHTHTSPQQPGGLLFDVTGIMKNRLRLLTSLRCRKRLCCFNSGANRNILIDLRWFRIDASQTQFRTPPPPTPPSLSLALALSFSTSLFPAITLSSGSTSLLFVWQPTAFREAPAALKRRRPCANG